SGKSGAGELTGLRMSGEQGFDFGAENDIVATGLLEEGRSFPGATIQSCADNLLNLLPLRMLLHGSLSSYCDFGLAGARLRAFARRAAKRGSLRSDFKSASVSMPWIVAEFRPCSTAC